MYCLKKDNYGYCNNNNGDRDKNVDNIYINYLFNSCVELVIMIILLRDIFIMVI